MFLSRHIMIHIILCVHYSVVAQIHYPQEVLTHDESDVLFAEMTQQEVSCEVDYLGCVGQSGYASVAIEVGSEPDMFYSHYLGGVDEVIHGVDDGGLSAVAQESGVQGYLCYAVFLCECSHLVVGEIAWVFAECPC